MQSVVGALVGIGAVCVACSSSDDVVGRGSDAGGDGRAANAGGSSGGRRGSGGSSAGHAGTNGTGASSDAGASGTGGGGNAGTSAGGGAGTSAGGGSGTGQGGSSSGGADASSGGSLAALCAAAAAAGCRKGPPSTADCIAHFQSIATCSTLLGCIACAGASPTVTCSSDGSPDVVGCESACNIDLCKEAGTSDSGPPTTACGAADFVTEPQGAQSPMTIAYTGHPIALFGPLESGERHGELGGQFEVTGLPFGALVQAKLVEFPCDRIGCPSDLSFGFNQGDGGRVTIGSSDAGCGSGEVFADANGHLTFGVGKTGSGPEEHNLGIMLFVARVDGGLADGGQSLCEQISGKACGKPLGVCTNAVWKCNGGVPVCQQFNGSSLPGPEVCTPDGGSPADENCNGFVDENCPCTAADEGKPCGADMLGGGGPSSCGRRGTTICVSGALQCQGALELAPVPDCCGGPDTGCDGLLGSTYGVCFPSGSTPYCP